MKKRMRDFVLPSLAGISCGLLFVFALIASQTLVRANLPGPGACPDAFDGTGPCTGGYCFKQLNGHEECKYFGGKCPGRACMHL